MANIKQVSLGVTATVAAIYMAPRDIKIPQRYVIAKLAAEVLSTMQAWIAAAESKPDGFSKRAIINLTEFVKWAIVEPLIALAYLVEKIVRMDFKSATEMSKELLENLTKTVAALKGVLERLEASLTSVEKSSQQLGRVDDEFGVQNQGSVEATATFAKQAQALSQHEISLKELALEIQRQLEEITAFMGNADDVEMLEAYSQVATQLVDRLGVVEARITQLETTLSEQEVRVSQKLEDLEALEHQVNERSIMGALSSEYIKTAKEVLIASRTMLRVLSRPLTPVAPQTA